MGNQCYRAASVIVALGLSLGCTKVVEDKTPAAAADADPASAELGRTLDTGKAISLNDATVRSALMEGIRARDIGQVEWALERGRTRMCGMTMALRLWSMRWLITIST